MSRVIIAAFGDGGDKWRINGKLYLDTPKHLIEIEGEQLLYRTIRQALKYSDDVWVSCSDDPRYMISKEVKYFKPTPTENIGGIGFLVDNEPIFSKDDRTVLLFGDTRYTNNAMRTIITDESRELVYYGRMGGSQLTGCGYGEGLAHSWYPEHKQELLGGCEAAIDAYRNGYFRTTSWEVARSYSGYADLSVHKTPKNFCEISGYTEDIDFPRDYITFTKALREAKERGEDIE